MEVITGKKSRHFEVDRQVRTQIIEKTVGLGKIIAIAPDRKHRTAFNCLTDTGVMVIRGHDGTTITLWIASPSQALDVWKRATGQKEMPESLYWQVQYNNNSKAWRQAVAA